MPSVTATAVDDGPEMVDFWEARSAILTAMGGYGNLRYLFSSSIYQRALRKARSGDLSRSELMMCVGHVSCRQDIPQMSSIDQGAARSLASTTAKAEEDGSYH